MIVYHKWKERNHRIHNAWAGNGVSSILFKVKGRLEFFSATDSFIKKIKEDIILTSLLY